jgi:uncharacterized protein
MKSLAENVPINSFDLFLTEKCNLNCTYCFHKQTDLTLDYDTGVRIIDKMHVINPNRMRISFFGGEPFLYGQLMLDLAKYAKTLWKDNLEFFVSTNATIFSEELFLELKELRFKIQVSLDGNQEITEFTRKGIDFNKAIANIRNMIKIFGKTLDIRMTYTPTTVGKLAEGIQFFYDLGIRKVIHHATMESNWTEEILKEYLEQLRQVYRFRRWTYKNGDPLNVQFIDNSLLILNDEMQPEECFCQAGNTYIAVIPNGDVYPCHRASGNRVFKLGNLFDDSIPIIRGMFLQINKRNSGCMEGCTAANTCHSCPITHYLVNKDLTKPLCNNGYCNICRIENNLAKEYLPTEISDRQDRKVNAISNIIIDLSEELSEIHDDLLKLVSIMATEEENG